MLFPSSWRESTAVVCSEQVEPRREAGEAARGAFSSAAVAEMMLETMRSAHPWHDNFSA